MIPDLYTLVVSWNLCADTLECIRSLFAAGAAPGTILVVDNGSTDGTPAALRAEFGEAVRIIEAGENLGLSGGINLGVRPLLERGAQWIFLLNNDTVVDPGLFGALAAAVGALPDVAVWGPQICYHADPQRVWSLGERRIAGSLLGRRAVSNDRYDSDLADPFPVDFVSGCAMLVRRDVFEAIGGFDAGLFLFAEEVDFCWRVARAGFRLAAAPQARLLHKVSLSTGRDRPQSRYYRTRNQIWVYRRYAGQGQRLFLFAFTLLRALRIAAMDLLRGDFALLRPLFSGWWDGWRAPRAAFPPQTALS